MKIIKFFPEKISFTIILQVLYIQPLNYAVFIQITWQPPNYSVPVNIILSAYKLFCPHTNYSIRIQIILSAYKLFCLHTNYSGSHTNYSCAHNTFDKKSKLGNSKTTPFNKCFQFFLLLFSQINVFKEFFIQHILKLGPTQKKNHFFAAKREIKLDWVPPGVTSDLASKYMRSLPQEHLSIQVRTCP